MRAWGAGCGSFHRRGAGVIGAETDSDDYPLVPIPTGDDDDE